MSIMPQDLDSNKTPRPRVTRCNHDGGTGIGAGHVCRCVREAGHPLDSDRPHGCSCWALWADVR